ncbi:NAD(P)H-dependent oxidoreductase [Helicobacter muridarum]|uniref:NAD(P)H-dependent oxidoreductase n=1 Tax=Helicobacter muridarum TaxID=216 RepID=A0A377PVL1_9HELI|nr:NAD(P)H-dependent oxidoreductase [Helicobacter muridarum]TLE00478.1 NAD(P)H-dependent oxidoreductase [Helicobacter muridarum]STQ86454.1 NAD(P)H-flavin oxidoreductase [Helicobacter muridarum]
MQTCNNKSNHYVQYYDEFSQAMRFRFACKKFDENKKIPCDVLYSILESGRLSPSSFGLEPTRMIVVKTKSMREKIKQACWNQDQISQASEVIVFSSLKADMLPNTNYILGKFSRRLKTSDEIKHYAKERYGNRKLEALGYISDIEKLGLWSAHQAYIMATTVMNHAAFLGIDSCMIEGFDKSQIESSLDMDTFKEQVSLVLCLGYRNMPQSNRLRMSLDEIVKFV